MSDKQNFVIINLTETTANKVTNLSGKDRGLSARQHFKIESLDQGTDKVKIVAPINLVTIAPSFFLGMFGASVKRLGRDEFLVKYQFDVSANLMRQILTGISRALIIRD